MSDFNSLFDGLYNKFILRDMFAKIAPGAIIFVSTLSLALGSLDAAIDYVLKLSFWPGLLILSISWTLGFLAQEAGIKMRLLSDSYTEHMARGDEKSLVDYYKNNIKIYIEAKDNYLKALERIVVIKEACGNIGIALAYAALVFLINGSIANSPILFVIFFAPAVYILLRAHRAHANRQRIFRNAYFEYLKDDNSVQNEPPNLKPK